MGRLVSVASSHRCHSAGSGNQSGCAHGHSVGLGQRFCYPARDNYDYLNHDYLNHDYDYDYHYDYDHHRAPSDDNGCFCNDHNCPNAVTVVEGVEDVSPVTVLVVFF